MRMLFQTAKAHLEKGENLALVTVIASSGATPRGAGAHMLVSEAGRLYGTIGGGAVEHRSIEIAQHVIQEKSSRAHDFSLTKDDVQALGMICGGDVRVFFTYLPAEDATLLKLLDVVDSRFQNGNDLWLILSVSANGALALFDHVNGFTDDTLPEMLTQSLKRKPCLVEANGQSY